MKNKKTPTMGSKGALMKADGTYVVEGKIFNKEDFRNLQNLMQGVTYWIMFPDEDYDDGYHGTRCRIYENGRLIN